MKHWVDGYTQKIHFGNCYIYHVLEPESATVEILCRGSSVHIGQFYLERNKKTSEKTHTEVTIWIEDYRKTFTIRLDIKSIG